MGQGLSDVKNKVFGGNEQDADKGEGASKSKKAKCADSNFGGDVADFIGTSTSETLAEGQFSVPEVLHLQQALKLAFAEDSMQKSLRRLEAQYPKRGQRGHDDQAAFTTQLQSLLLHVYRTVLPQKPWCLQAGWGGYKEMLLRSESASEDPRVIQGKEEINRLLGLPRLTVIRPPAEEPVFIETPDGSGNELSCASPMLVDADGDAAHEFWEEGKGGKLMVVEPAATCGLRIE
eukprot:TRINITY_DN87909_c0_g1_i1.p1 TRINITY_DN87909_c0_g1~~TRINITY_DN87909_c0_g1_i1.p1  ORF type:complete len:233 (+),score=47.16 TRINITY_DN87909_c0_g1_i1:232-930(+)